MFGLAYDDFLGVSPTTGIVYQHIQDGVVKESFIIRRLIDFLSFPGSYIASQGYDGTFTFFTINYPFVERVILKSESSDQIKLILSDDWSGLEVFRVTAGCAEENRE